MKKGRLRLRPGKEVLLSGPPAQAVPSEEAGGNIFLHLGGREGERRVAGAVVIVRGVPTAFSKARPTLSARLVQAAALGLSRAVQELQERSEGGTHKQWQSVSMFALGVPSLQACRLPALGGVNCTKTFLDIGKCDTEKLTSSSVPGVLVLAPSKNVLRRTPSSISSPLSRLTYPVAGSVKYNTREDSACTRVGGISSCSRWCECGSTRASKKSCSGRCLHKDGCQRMSATPPQ